MGIDLWSWLLAGLGIAQIVMTGRHMRSGWLVGLATSAVWAAFAIATSQYGFLVSAVVFASIHVRNWLAWGAPPEREAVDG